MAVTTPVVRRVLFSESSRNVGGQELQLLAQAAGLQTRGIESRILCRADSRLAQVAGERGLPIVAVPFRNSLHWPSIAAVHRELRTFRPDALLCHSGHDANTGALAARLLGRRPALLRARTYQHGLPHAWTYNQLFDRTLVPSSELRLRLLANPRIDPQRVHLLYPGIDFAAVARRSREALPEETARALAALPGALIVHAAMLRPEKGHLLMLDVLAALRARGLVAGYAIAGEGEIGEALKARVAELGLAPQVAFLGMLGNVPALLARAALVVMPSSYEPLGMSQIEALSLGVPVLGSRVGGIPETIRDGETGLLAAAEDRAAWADRLAYALRAPAAMGALARCGQRDVTQRFSLTANLDQLLDHITTCRAPRP